MWDKVDTFLCLIKSDWIYHRKDKELAAMADKLEEEQAEVVKTQKQIKDMAVS